MAHPATGLDRLELSAGGRQAGGGDGNDLREPAPDQGRCGPQQ
jgi:hypothetical protein